MELTSQTSENPGSVGWQRTPWRYAAISFLIGVVYSGVAVVIGLEIKLGDTNVTWLVGGLIECSFAVFGYLLGLTVESRRREKASADKSQRQMEDLATIHARLAQVEKLASLGQLAGAVAHEVRNPLAIIRTQAQNLRETFSKSALEWEALEAMIEEIDRLAHVTSSLLGLARPMSFRREPVEIREILYRSDLLSRQLLTERDLEVVFQGSGSDSPIIEGDLDLLCQVLLGLLENAAKMSPPRGKIEVGWRRIESGVEILVCDRGPGVPEQLKQKIFEPFFTTRPDGNGLGLAVARQIVDGHGGEISVGDDGPPGACFLVRLPLKTSQEAVA